jgi:hypothetical protein
MRALKLVSAATAVVTAAALASVPSSSASTPRSAVQDARSSADQASPLHEHGGHPADVRGSDAPAAPVPTSSIRGVSAAASAQRPATSGTVKVAVRGSADAVSRAVAAAGGRALVSANGESTVVVPKAKLAAVASATGVSSIDVVHGPHLDSGPDATVTDSNTAPWHGSTAGQGGDGVKVAIVDAGFGVSQTEFDNEVAAGHLGATTQLVNEDCTDSSNTQTPYITPHGLAVAEIVQAQAPRAQLYLYCVGSETGVAAAETAIEAAGVKIVSSSLSWFGDARGDGTGPASSVAASVAKARTDGIVWFNSTGNYNLQHWSGSLTDNPNDHYVDIGNNDGSTYPFESDFFYTAPGSFGAPTWLDFEFQWDEWPTTNTTLRLEAYGIQCTAQSGSGGFDNCQGQPIGNAAVGQPSVSAQNVLHQRPEISINTSSFANTSTFPQIWEVDVYRPGVMKDGAHYDLWGLGDTYFASDLACQQTDASNHCINTPVAALSSVTSPANSPFAVGVGAVDTGVLDGATAGTFEYFSSEGPTIDGRVKPEISGWDGDNTWVPEYAANGFFGTSAATPSVAGAAADVLGEHPTWDESQVQNYVEQTANVGYGGVINPAVNGLGHGRLRLGSPVTASLPGGAKYAPLPSPIAILDTRKGLLGSTLTGPKGLLNAGQAVTVPLPDAIPATATAVVVDLAGASTTGNTYLSAYAGHIAFPNTSNVNLTTTDSTATVLAVVTVGSGKSITVRNNGPGKTYGIAAVVGYYDPAATGGYVPVTPTRVLDTRTSTGGHLGKIPADTSYSFHVGVPATATAIIANITATDTTNTSYGFLSATSDCNRSFGVVNYTTLTRADTAVVPLDASGNICVGTAHYAADVIVDVVGYISPTSGASFFALPASQQIVDTRNGKGGHLGAIVGPATDGYQGTGVGDVPGIHAAAGASAPPNGAVALLANVVGVNATGPTYLAAFAGTGTTVTTSNLNITPGRIVSNAAFIGVDGNGVFGVYNHAYHLDAVVSISGYFM